MKLDEIIQGKFSVFSRMNDENKNKHIETVKYIRTLSNNVGINISTWNLFEVFGTAAGGNTLRTDRARINKIFWERFKAGDAPPPPEPVDKESVTANINSWLEQSGRSFVSSALQRVTRNRDDARRQAEDYHRAYNEHLAKTARLTSEMYDLANNPPDIATEISKIIDAGFFKFKSIDNGVITFITDNIINTDIRPSAGLDLTVNLGSYQVRYDLNAATHRSSNSSSRRSRDNLLSVHKHENNIRVGGYYHPHISSSSSICWGDGVHKADDALISHRPSDAFTILAAVLSTYNPEDPYVLLHSFDKMKDAINCRNCGEQQYIEADNNCHNCGYDGRDQNNNNHHDEEEEENSEW